MFVCKKNSSCIGCNYQYADRLDQIDEEFRNCGSLIEVQEVKHGRWKRKEIHTVWGIHWEYECTNCGIICPASAHYHELVGHDYCPYCGAKMDLQ